MYQVMSRPTTPKKLAKAIESLCWGPYGYKGKKYPPFTHHGIGLICKLCNIKTKYDSNYPLIRTHKLDCPHLTIRKEFLLKWTFFKKMTKKNNDRLWKRWFKKRGK